MPDDETSNSIFVEALERWEQPRALSAGSDLAAERAREASPGRFLRELESWEWPAQPEEIHQIVLAPERRPDPVLRKLLLRVKGTIQVIAGRALDVWAGKPVFLERAGRGLVRAGRLDSLGGLRFGELVPGEYVVHTSGLSGLVGRYSSALVGAPLSSEAEAAALNQEREFPESGLRVSVKLEPQSEISITFSAKDEKFADAVVRFAFSDPSTGEIQLSGKVVLSEPPWQTGTWVGRWQYAAGKIRNCELLFVVELKMRSISVLGAMVPEISVNGGEGMPLDVLAKLVKLTLTAVSKKTGESTLRPAQGMQAWPDFEQAAQDAFAWWKKDQQHRVDVVWKMEPYPSGSAPKDDRLPELKGPSLGGAFVAALTLLYYRYYREYRVSEKPRPDETKFATTVAHIDPLSFAISATIATPELWAEKIVLGPVGHAKYKAVVDLLVLSDQQSDAPKTAIQAHTIEDALNRVLDRHASILVS